MKECPGRRLTIVASWTGQHWSRWTVPRSRGSLHRRQMKTRVSRCGVGSVEGEEGELSKLMGGGDLTIVQLDIC